MSSTTDNTYYDTMDNKYLELGIALTTIDRMNPGKIPFCIPVLTPTMNQSGKVDTKVIQSNNKSSIVSENSGAVDVSNISISNYIEIEIPKELCCLPAPIYDIVGDVSISNGAYNFKGTATIVANGDVSDGNRDIIPIGHIDVDGSITTSGVNNNLSGTIEGTITTTLNESNRYIPKNSRWLIAFLGGDISKPCVVCRLP